MWMADSSSPIRDPTRASGAGGQASGVSGSVLLPVHCLTHSKPCDLDKPFNDPSQVSGKQTMIHPYTDEWPTHDLTPLAP